MTVNHDVVGSSPTGGVKKTLTIAEAVVFFLLHKHFCDHDKNVMVFLRFPFYNGITF